MNKVYGSVKFVGMPVYSHQYDDINFYVLQSETMIIKSNQPATVRIRTYLPESIVMNQDITPISVRYQITGRLINSWVKFHEDLSVVVDELKPATDDTDMDQVVVEVTGVVSKITTTPENMKSFFGFMMTTTDDKNAVVVTRVLSRGSLMRYVSKEVQVGLVATVKGYLTNLFNKSDSALLTEVTAYAVSFKPLSLSPSIPSEESDGKEDVPSDNPQ